MYADCICLMTCEEMHNTTTFQQPFFVVVHVENSLCVLCKSVQLSK